MNINRLVLDLSHHESVQSYSKVKADGIVGIIWKATQGQSFHDDEYFENRERAKAQGLIWGSYHFADGTNVSGQVQNYLNFAKIKPDELFCLDLEDYSSQMSLDQARSFVTQIEGALSRPNECVIYSGNTLKEMLGDRKDPFWGARRLWLAQYGNQPTVQKSWDTYWLWQYSDGEYGPEPHDVDGISDAVDSNHFDGTPDQLKSQWSGSHVPPEPEPELEVKLLITAPPGVKVIVTQV